MKDKVWGETQVRRDGFSTSTPTCVLLVKLCDYLSYVFKKLSCFVLLQEKLQVNSLLSSLDGLVLIKL